MKINIKGDIISDRQQRFYDWLGIAGTSPSKVIGALPKGKRDIEVVVNSGGGDVFAGSEIYTALKEYEGNVTVKVVGIAASAASVIAMAGDKVLISPTAQMMIHNVSTQYVSGDHRTFAHTAEVLKSANQSIANAYKAKTGKTDDELLSLMDDETWFNAEKAVQQGFADEILAFSKDESKNNQLLASFNETFLTPEAIERLEAFINDPAPPTQNNGQQLEARLKLLKMKGEHLQ
ncbi:MAG: head maturation protease, ClpP-related [Solibacillus sp.]|uniref:head maturation protease, ClpP-related n=1 Tax=Solibacillus sp. TaxID=1909654 RepID=UPI003314EA30